MGNYTSIVWDWNGTLLDDVQLSLDIVNEILTEQGIAALTVNRYKEIFDIPASVYWERAGMDLQAIPFEAVSLAFCARFEQRVHTAALFPGARHVLHQLRQRRIAQFLLSSTEHQALMRMLMAFQLQDAFNGIHGMANTLAFGKFGGGRVLLDIYDLQRHRTVFIGDTTHDAEVASALGAACILLSTGHQSRGRLVEAGCPVVDSCEELLQALAELDCQTKTHCPTKTWS